MYPVDPSQMNTEAGRQMAERFNRDAAAARLRIHRSVQVLSEFFFYEHEWQLMLTEAAIMRAVMVTAVHGRRSEADARFYAIVDMMYVSTDDAQTSYSASDIEQITVAASAINDHLFPESGIIFSESARHLRNQHDNTLKGQVGSALLPLLLDNLIEHARPDHLQQLIACCGLLCVAAALYTQGAESGIQEAAEKTIEATGAIVDSIVERVDLGELIVEDGNIIRPPASDYEDDDDE